MNILMAHNRYQQSGGEDAVFEQESAMLMAAGHTVRRFRVDNDHIHGFAAKVAAGRAILVNKTAVRALLDAIGDNRPDIVHIHNFFPTLSPGAIDAVARRGVPVVVTLHNYRLICPSAQLLRQDRPCEECLGASRMPAVWHGCYHGSRIGTALVATMGWYCKRLLHRYSSRVTLIALTEFAKSRFVADGFTPDNIVVRGNSIADPGPGATVREPRIVYAGRLSPEKGVNTLLRATQDLDIAVEIIGDGPDGPRLRAMAAANAVFRGQLPPAQVIERLKSATALVVPSRWYEGFPMVVLEAMATGTPVLASRLGSLAEIIRDGETGHLVAPDDLAAWRAALSQLVAEPWDARRLGDQARARFLEQHSTASGAATLTAIYQQARAKLNPGNTTCPDPRSPGPGPAAKRPDHKPTLIPADRPHRDSPAPGTEDP
ncbi:MAG: glycosyltransferase [Azospirillaceae bacterium]|nr:glycosyltransferase [Azospirillaceae bacterium]